LLDMNFDEFRQFEEFSDRSNRENDMSFVFRFRSSKEKGLDLFKSSKSIEVSFIHFDIDS
jgi:hypothetical protein